MKILLFAIMIAGSASIVTGHLEAGRTLRDLGLKQEVLDNEKWKGGTWDDPTEDNFRYGWMFRIGEIEKNVSASTKWGWSYGSTKGSGTHADEFRAGDYHTYYISPLSRSDLAGELYILQRLGDWDFGRMGKGNRHKKSGWGINANPDATTVNPISKTAEAIYSTKYVPAKWDEMSVVTVTWQEKVKIVAEITHNGWDSDMAAFAWLNPTVETIDGDEVSITCKISNGTVHSETTEKTATLSYDKDGVALQVGLGVSKTYTAYDSLTLTASVKSIDHTVDVMYSVNEPVPSEPLVTRHTLNWVVRIDDNNSLWTTGVNHDPSSFKYEARIQTAVRPKKIIVDVGTQGKPSKAALPGFLPPPAFRDFNKDKNVRKLAFKDKVKKIKKKSGF